MADGLQKIENRYKDQFITVSNELIRARETTTLLESKIEALAISYMKKDMRQRTKKDANGNDFNVNYVVVPAKEIVALMPKNFNTKKKAGGKDYAEIKSAATSMKRKLFIIEDRESKKFLLRNMYGDIGYDDGRLYIEFEPTMQKYFVGLAKNFSKLKLPILFSYKKMGGLQLYKLLKSYAYAPHLKDIDMSLSQEELPSLHLHWSLTDLRMEMGYVDLSQTQLRKEGAKDQPDWEKMEKIEKNPKYKNWCDFNNRVIKPGVLEVNALSDLYIKDVIKDTTGKGGKVVGLTFVVQHNKAYYESHIDEYSFDNDQNEKSLESNEMSYEEKEDFLDNLSELIHEKLKLKDLKAIAEAADYDMDKIKKVYELSRKSSKIEDITGWMIAGIKGNYLDKVKGTGGKENSFKNFEERSYDFDALEKQFARN